MQDLINYLNNKFDSEEEFILCEKFILSTNGHLEGKLSIDTLKGVLSFDVSMPSAYPLGSINFKCTNISNYNHQNTDNSLCLHPTPNADLHQKLEEEINLLKEWVQRFYINEEKDSRYQYLVFNHQNEHFLFDNTVKDLKKGAFGSFSFCPIATNSYLILNFDAINLGWSNFWINTKDKVKGLWLYIEDEPILQQREIVKNWLDLEKYLNDNQFRHINTFRGKNLPLLIGYKIPKDSSFEIHWEVILIHKDFFPTEAVKINKVWTGQCLDLPIKWGKSYNASYERYFGRGKLHDRLTNSKILLIGLGAIGSNIATNLARGGAKNLNLMDFDTVEPGNICRSEYVTRDLIQLKIVALFNQLISISPFIEVENEKYLKIPYFSSKTEHYDVLRKSLGKYDFIIDCTTDNELSYYLDSMNLENTEILNFSITNKAKNLVFVTGQNINKDVIHIFNTLENENATYFEGTGCQYPTFEASYNDINVLVSCALKNINLRFQNEMPLRNFVVTPNNEIGNFKVEINEY